MANGVLLRSGVFDDLWIQPAAGDAGGALGAALFAWHQVLDQPRQADGVTDFQRGSYLGPAFTQEQIGAFFERHGYPYQRLDDGQIAPTVAALLTEEKVVGWHQGRMEFGPRALGSRSIVGDARSPKMQEVMNLKIKYRESFRPFAPSVINEKAPEVFDIDRGSPYMLLVADVRKERQKPMTEAEKDFFGLQKLYVVRSDVPAITHVDYSARLQTVHADTNPLYHAMISEFDRLTGCPVIINTSFNVRGEPIVCTPEDAYRCFMRTEMDALVVGNFLLHKAEQPALEEAGDWRDEFELD